MATDNTVKQPDHGAFLIDIARTTADDGGVVFKAFGGADAFHRTLDEIDYVDTHRTARPLTQDFCKDTPNCEHLSDLTHEFLTTWSARNRQSLPAIAMDLAGTIGISRDSILTGEGLNTEELAPARAMMLVAARAEMIKGHPPGEDSFDITNQFHDTLHTASLPLTSMAIMREHQRLAEKGLIEPYSRADMLMVFILGLIHDADHNGRPNPQDKRYWNETLSFERVAPILKACGVPLVQRTFMRQGVLMTSPNGGVQRIKAISRQLHDGVSRAWYPDFRTLKEFEMIATLVDSDTSFSSVMGEENAAIMSNFLTLEQQAAGIKCDFKTASARAGFLNHVITPHGLASSAGRSLFQEAFEATLEAANVNAHAEAEAARLAAAPNP